MADRSLYCKNTILGFLRKKEPLFGGWRAVAFLGAGAFGCVFKLEREDLGAKFVSALKVISLTKRIGDEGGSLDSLQDAISQEAKELVHLYSLGGHQNVVGWHNHQIFHIRDKESVTALMAVMMDYLPNNLSKEIKKGPIPWERALQLLADCLRGLQHIHSKQVIHRDIKPENIFINDEGMARIGDFGVARQVSENDHAETRVGTPLYIAPEVIKDPYGHGYDFQVDVYSLGLVGYEMLVGHLPFYEEAKGNKNLMVKKRLSGSPITMPHELPQGVRDVVLGAVQYDLDRRYSSAQEFMDAVNRVLETEGLATHKPLQIVRVMPESSSNTASANWQQATHNYNSTGAMPPAGTAAQQDAPAALASVISSNSQQESGAPDGAAATGAAGTTSSATRTQYDDDDDDDFFGVPPKKPSSPRQTYRPKSSATMYGHPHDGRSIYGVEDPYATKKKSKGFNSWEVGAFIASLGCYLSLHFRYDENISSMLFLGVYVIAAFYFSLVVTKNRALVTMFFGASLIVQKYLKIGSVQDMLAVEDMVLLVMYGVTYAFAPKVRQLFSGH